MQFGYDVSWMREELTSLGIEELKTSEDVDHVMAAEQSGTMLLVINSVCGCSAGGARPAVAQALKNTKKPERLYTVFAGQDKEATATARGYFSEFPPSSPAFAFFKDGQIKAMIPRHRIEGRSPEQIAADLKMVFDAFCEETANV